MHPILSSTVHVLITFILYPFTLDILKSLWDFVSNVFGTDLIAPIIMDFYSFFFPHLNYYDYYSLLRHVFFQSEILYYRCSPSTARSEISISYNIYRVNKRRLLKLWVTNLNSESVSSRLFQRSRIVFILSSEQTRDPMPCFLSDKACIWRIGVFLMSSLLHRPFFFH